jgi:hypothetical protein
MYFFSYLHTIVACGVLDITKVDICMLFCEATDVLTNTLATFLDASLLTFPKMEMSRVSLNQQTRQVT